MANLLKEQIQKDLEAINTMKAPLMEASLYYKEIFKKLGLFFLIFMCSEFLISLAYCLMGNSMFGEVNNSDYLRIPLLETLIFGGPICLIIAFFILPQTLSKLVIFEYYYKDQLQSGPFIATKIRSLKKLIYNFFFMVSFITGAYAGAIIIGNFIACFASLFIIPKIIGMEFDRLAIPSITAFFAKPTEHK